MRSSFSPIVLSAVVFVALLADSATSQAQVFSRRSNIQRYQSVQPRYDSYRTRSHALAPIRSVTPVPTVTPVQTVTPGNRYRYGGGISVGSYGYGYGYGGNAIGFGFGLSSPVPVAGSPLLYDPWATGRFQAPDLMDDPYFRAHHKFDSRYPGRYSRPPMRLKNDAWGY